ncbi:MAG: DUF1972 domain-containing protein [Rikenellaceae bacterium]
MKKVAIIGTVGVPAKYGGFETLVENIIGDNASKEVEYTVFCSSKDCSQTPEYYKGARLKYVYLHANGIQSILYDGVSLLKSIRGYDVVVALGVSGGIFFPFFKLFSRSRFIVNIDGLEWKRGKWGKVAKFILHLSEKLAVRIADVIIADNQGIVDHVTTSYRKNSSLIAYGGDHVVRNVSEATTKSILAKYRLTAKEYAITVCRIEPENNCDKILEAFKKSNTTLIFIGNWDKGEYGRRLKREYCNIPNINIVDAVYDLDSLHVLRTNSKYYIHGHSAGGTNPSLVEAMYSKCNILAYDVIYNRATTEDKAHYFNSSFELIQYLSSKELSDNSTNMFEIADRRYKWEVIARQYESLY